MIITRDGRAHVGRILSETGTGYLVAASGATHVVAFGDIADLRALQPSSTMVVEPARASPAQPPPPPPPYAPHTEAASVQYAVTPASASPVDWLEQRRGFHLGIGAGAFGYGIEDQVSNSGYSYSITLPVGFMTLQAPMDWNFGRLTFRVTPQLRLLLAGPQTFFTVGADAQLQFNLAEVYSLGFGYDQGLTFGAFNGYTGALSLTPARFNLGDRGQHQLSASLSLPFLFAGSTSFRYPLVGLVRPTVAYTYVF